MNQRTIVDVILFAFGLLCVSIAAWLSLG